jgi:hypothetical protein
MAVLNRGKLLIVFFLLFFFFVFVLIEVVLSLFVVT